MSIFRCDKCGCIENTALSNYWFEQKKICSACDPAIGKWHEQFKRRSAVGMLLGEDGFLYSKIPTHTKIVNIIGTEYK